MLCRVYFQTLSWVFVQKAPHREPTVLILLSTEQFILRKWPQTQMNPWGHWEGRHFPPNNAASYHLAPTALFSFLSLQVSVGYMTSGLLDVLWRTTSSRHGDSTLYRRSKSWRLTAPCSRQSQFWSKYRYFFLQHGISGHSCFLQAFVKVPMGILRLGHPISSPCSSAK